MPIKTLFVDDERALLDQTEIFLEKGDEEIEVMTASSAERALEMMEEEDFDVIVSDYQMPGLDGLEFLEEIRKEREDEIPFIMFTGKGREKVAMKALNIGADRYLQKGGDPKSQYGVLADSIKQEYEHFQSERKYRTVVENSHDAIYIYRGDELLFVNDRAVEITGYGREELHDMKLWELLHPDDRQWVKKIGEKRSEGEDVPSEYNARLITKEGKTKHLLVTVTPIDFKGQRAFLGSARDISERKRREKELREERNFIEQIAETSPVCITKVDKNGDITYANDKAESILGLSKSKIKGRTYDDPDWEITDYEGEEFPDKKLPFNQVKEKGEAVYDVRHAIEWPDGERKLLSINAAPLYDEDEKFDGMVATSEDVTEKVRKTRELKETKNRLSEIIEGVSVPIFVIDKDHNVTHWNRALEELSGLPHDEMIGTKDPWRAFYKEERPVLADIVVEGGSKEKVEDHYGDKAQEASLLPDTYEGEDLFPDMGEDGVWMYFTATPIKDSEGRIIGAIETLQDISERKRTEERRKKEHRRLKTLMSNMPGMVYRCENDRDWTMRFISEGCYELTGYEPDDVIDNEVVSYGELIHPEDRSRVWEEVQEAVEKGEPFETEYRIETSSGEIKWVWERGRVVESKDEVGNLEGMITDITERKEMEEKLKQRMSAVEGSIDGIGILDEDETYTYLNETHAHIYGYESPEELIGETWRALYDEEEQKRFENEIMPKVREGGEWRGKAVGMKKDGTRFPQELSLTALEDGGLICVVRDITERKEAEKRLEVNKNKIERLHEISAELQTYDSEEDVYSFAIKAAEDILDFDICAINAPEGDEMKAIVTSSRFPREAASGDKPLPIDDSLAGRTHLEKRSFLVKDKEKNDDINPTSEDFESGISVPIGEHAVFQAVSTEESDFDEDDLNMAELLMSHVSEALQRIQMKKREEFLHSLLRHDVGNKNQIIDGYLELMKDHDLPDEVRDFVGKAEQAVDESRNIIDKIRELRKVEVEEDIDEMDLMPIIDEVSSEHEDKLEDKEINIDVKGVECEVEGGSLLKELFNNLIENSIQHSNCSEIRINVRTREDECVVTVEDDGTGISDELKEKIFEKRFKRGKKAGTGLGLYIVKEIAETYGGGVEVIDSELGGVGFDVHLKKVG
ncbi:MAG: PAS domain S-box protein [Candidatus Thermoplasmatota archaeon]|nr:PAS domain S-box protein [Candidatus Thermoplasmatota archaeon]